MRPKTPASDGKRQSGTPGEGGQDKIENVLKYSWEFAGIRVGVRSRSGRPAWHPQGAQLNTQTFNIKYRPMGNLAPLPQREPIENRLETGLRNPALREERLAKRLC